MVSERRERRELSHRTDLVAAQLAWRCSTIRMKRPRGCRGQALGRSLSANHAAHVGTGSDSLIVRCRQCPVCPKADMPGSPRDVAEVPAADKPGAGAIDRFVPQEKTMTVDNVAGEAHRFVASAPAALRASSMKVCATGLSVRFFNVTMASGLGVDGSTIGSAFIVCPGTGNCSATRGIIDR